MIRPTLSALLAAPLLALLPPVADDLSFHPSDGTEVTRLYSLDLAFQLDDLSAVVAGQDISEMIAQGDMSVAAEIALKVTESFVRSAEGRPLELIRYFEETRGEIGPEGESEPIDNVDELEGKRVRFLWNEEEGAYDVSYHESEGEEEILQGLGPDMDLRALLPDKQVAAGDTWNVDSRQLSSVLLFGAQPQPVDGEAAELFDSALKPQLEALLEQFKTTCEYLGERDVDGRKVGAVAVVMHGEGKIDLSELILNMVRMNSGGEQVQVDVAKAEVALTFDSKGEFLWDLAGGHLRAFDMSGDSDLSIEISATIEAAGQSQSGDVDAELTATGSWKIAPADA